MGAAQSSNNSGLAQISYLWLLQHRDAVIKYASGSSLETFEQGGTKLLALAYQASEASCECSTDQHIRFQLSKDGGETWTASKVVVWGLGPCWAPVLFFDKQKSRRLFLFYSESRKAYSPGGDIKFITSEDAGETWTPPVTIYTHETDGECPKLAANKPVVDSSGNWYLAIQREPAHIYRTFSAHSFHPMKENPSLPKVAVPATAAPQITDTSAGVLRSSDGGSSWAAFGSIQDPKTWLIEPSIEIGTKGQLIMLFRTAAGKVYMSQSVDKGVTWSKPTATTLPNPNSKVATVTIDGQLLCVYNNSATVRTPLALALTVDDCRSWDPLAVIEAEPTGKFSCPSMVQWSEDTVKVAYTVWGEGLKLATIRLATVES